MLVQTFTISYFEFNIFYHNLHCTFWVTSHLLFFSLVENAKQNIKVVIYVHLYFGKGITYLIILKTLHSLEPTRPKHGKHYYYYLTITEIRLYTSRTQNSKSLSSRYIYLFYTWIKIHKSSKSFSFVASNQPQFGTETWKERILRWLLYFTLKCLKKSE